MTERLGVFGGTFDPIHVGHLVIAEDFREALRLDRVLFVVAKDPWQKIPGASAGVRYEMVKRAIRFIPWATPTNMELQRVGPTRTIDTVEALSSPERDLFLLLGQDQWDNRQTWVRWREIARQTEVHVTPRWLGISSTDIRQRRKLGHSIKHLVPDAVQIYIEEHNIYPKELPCETGFDTPTERVRPG